MTPVLPLFTRAALRERQRLEVLARSGSSGVARKAQQRIREMTLAALRGETVQ